MAVASTACFFRNLEPADVHVDGHSTVWHSFSQTTRASLICDPVPLCSCGNVGLALSADLQDLEALRHHVQQCYYSCFRQHHP